MVETKRLDDTTIIHLDVTSSKSIRYATSTKTSYKDGKVIEESSASTSQPTRVQFNTSSVENNIYKMDGWISTKFYLVPKEVTKVKEYIEDGKDVQTKLFYLEYLDSNQNHYTADETLLIRAFIKAYEVEIYK